MIFLALLLSAPPQIPYDRLPEDVREDVRRVVDRETLSVPIEAETVRSTPEIYEFLLENLPFTASVVRAMDRGTYDIWTEASVARRPAVDEAETERRGRTYYLNDGDGLVLRAVRACREEGHWVFYTYGYYRMAPLPRVYGWSVIQLWYAPDGESLRTEAVVHVRLSGLTETVAEAMPDLVREMVEEKSAAFVEAAKTVTEAAREDPEGLLRSARASPDVDPAALEEFRRRFLPESP